MTRAFPLCLLAMAATSSSAFAQLNFNISSTGNPEADAGFATAAQVWQGFFDDPVTVNVTAGFEALPTGVLGQAGSARVTTPFSNFKTAISNDITSTDDAIFSNNLPAGNAFSVFINRTSNNPNGANSATPYVDNNNGANNTQVRLTRANAKALGIVPANSATVDADITFSNLFSFDFDPSNGIGAGLIDFVGVAVHELGHAMGFTSGILLSPLVTTCVSNWTG